MEVNNETMEGIAGNWRNISIWRYDLSDIEPGQTLDFSDFEYSSFGPPGSGDFFLLEYLSGSDYVGDTVTRSNYLWFVEHSKDSPAVYKMDGYPGGYGVALRRGAEIETSLVEALAELADYPLFCDESLSELELELESDWWATDGFRDFVSKIESEIEDRFNLDFYALPMAFRDETDGPAFGVFHELCEKANRYPEFETGCNIHMPLDDLVEDMPNEALLALTIYGENIEAYAEKEARERASGFLDAQAKVNL